MERAITTMMAVGVICALSACSHGSSEATSRTTEAKTEASPRKGMPRVDPADGDFSGTVTSRLEAGSYTYLEVQTDHGDEWVVTLGGGKPVGAAVKVKNMGVRNAFHSRRLNRTFARLVFGIVRNRS